MFERHWPWALLGLFVGFLLIVMTLLFATGFLSSINDLRFGPNIRGYTATGILMGLLSLLFVFLILAGLYESWSLPFSVLLSTPIAVCGAFVVLLLRGMQFNIYAQIGLIVLIGLAAKNAILIVEFAKVEYEGGKELGEAALAGARLRLRPILMTSFAFILGCLPLAFSSGAGAIARNVMGSGVIGGMLAATGIAIFLIPMMFYVIEKFSSKGKGHEGQVKPDEEKHESDR